MSPPNAPHYRGHGARTQARGGTHRIATYVGFELGFAVFLAFCALRPERLRLGPSGPRAA